MKKNVKSFFPSKKKALFLKRYKSIYFDISDKTIPLAEARRAAVEDARLKAEELALAAGVTLGDVQSINESGGDPVPVFEGSKYPSEDRGCVCVQPGVGLIEQDEIRRDLAGKERFVIASRRIRL